VDPIKVAQWAKELGVKKELIFRAKLPTNTWDTQARGPRHTLRRTVERLESDTGKLNRAKVSGMSNVERVRLAVDIERAAAELIAASKKLLIGDVKKPTKRKSK
jgi:hypothetical protein